MNEKDYSYNAQIVMNGSRISAIVIMGDDYLKILRKNGGTFWEKKIEWCDIDYDMHVEIISRFFIMRVEQKVYSLKIDRDTVIQVAVHEGIEEAFYRRLTIVRYNSHKKREELRLESIRLAEVKRRMDAERKAREEAIRLQEEEKARLRAEAIQRKNLENERRLREEQEKKARLEAERIAQKERIRQEELRVAELLKAQQEAERKAQEERARQEAKRRAEAAKAYEEAERRARIENARWEAERKAYAEKIRQEEANALYETQRNLMEPLSEIALKDCAVPKSTRKEVILNKNGDSTQPTATDGPSAVCLLDSEVKKPSIPIKYLEKDYIENLEDEERPEEKDRAFNDTMQVFTKALVLIEEKKEARYEDDPDDQERIRQEEEQKEFQIAVGRLIGALSEISRVNITGVLFSILKKKETESLKRMDYDKRLKKQKEEKFQNIYREYLNEGKLNLHYPALKSEGMYLSFDTPWSLQEAAVLLESVLQIMNKEITRKEAIRDVSKKLRNQAILDGYEISAEYRNEIDVMFQMYSMESAYKGYTGVLTASKLFSMITMMREVHPDEYVKLVNMDSI